MPATEVVLFDIDGTLLHSLSAVIGAMRVTMHELYGIDADFSKVQIHGRLDTLIWRDMGRQYGYPLDDASHAAFKRAYIGHLQQRFQSENTAKAYPGARALVEAVRSAQGLTIGLLTVNYAETGRLKVRYAGFNPDEFIVNAWGDDGPDRRSLVPVAMRRYAELEGRPAEPARVTIIGDTPADVDCAKANGARVIGVATGTFGIDALREAGADLAVKDLTDTPVLARWIVGD